MSGDVTMVSLDLLEQRLGYRFKDRRILERAMTHPSYANERRSRGKHNQRLEFLGDSVIGMIISSYLYEEKEFEDEGALTFNLSSMVCEPALANKARQLELGTFLRLGKGEDGQGGRERDSILCDAYEAMVAAIFVDGGYEVVRDVIANLHEKELGMIRKPKADSPNHKGQLQKVVQAKYNTQPHYKIVNAYGPEHDKIFVAEASLNGEIIGHGEGRSKKLAEQKAAENAYEEFGSSWGVE